MNCNSLQTLRLNLRLSSSPRRNTLHLTCLRMLKSFENAQTFSEHKPLTKCCTKNLTIPPSFKFNIIQSFAFILTPYILHLIDLVRFDISWNLNQRAFTVVLVFSFLSWRQDLLFAQNPLMCIFALFSDGWKVKIRQKEMKMKS